KGPRGEPRDGAPSGRVPLYPGRAGVRAGAGETAAADGEGRRGGMAEGSDGAGEEIPGVRTPRRSRAGRALRSDRPEGRDGTARDRPEAGSGGRKNRRVGMVSPAGEKLEAPVLRSP